MISCSEGTSADKYRALLQSEDKDDGNKEMEITWGIDLQNKVDKKTKEKQRKDAGLGELTPFEEMMQKKRSTQVHHWYRFGRDLFMKGRVL